MSNSCRSYHEEQDTFKAIGGLIFLIIFVVICLIDCIGKDEREARQRQERASKVTACSMLVEHGGFYADPLGKTCGVLKGKQYIPGSFDACYKVLVLPEFAEIRHCWKEAMEKAVLAQPAASVE